jgi:ribosomal protein S4E
MNDLADYKRTHHKTKYGQDFPEGILDVIETDYHSKYFLMLEDRTQITTLFSNEEWIDILTKSRISYRGHIQRMNSTRKYSAQGY